MKKIILFIFIITILSTIAPTSHGEQVQVNVDCSYYYIIALKILKIYLINQSEALELANTLVNVTLPQNIEKYHRNYYNDIIALIEATSNHNNGKKAPQQTLKALTNIYIKLPKDYIKYSQRLAQCIHDPQIAALTGAETRILIKYKVQPLIKQTIYEIISSASSNNLTIITDRKEYLPGENATILLLAKNKLELSRLELVEWPTLRLIKDYTIDSKLIHNYTVMRIEMPYANQLSYIIPSEFARKEIVSLAIIVTFKDIDTGQKSFNIRIINVTYRIPRVTIVAPKSVYQGELLNVSVESDGYYPNATVSVNDEVIYTINISKGINKIIVDLNKLNITRSIILLQVKIPPGKDYLGVEKDKPILYVPSTLPVKIEAPHIIYTWLGWISLRTYKNTSADVTLEVNIWSLTLHRSSLTNGTISFYASVLPITPLHISASTNINGREVTYSKNIIVINPTFLAALSLVILMLTYPERLEHLVLITITRKAEPLSRIPLLARRGTITIYSKIAQLYYRTIMLLKARLPYPHETLREHFTSLQVSEKIRNPLWRLLRLAEKDLYGKNKPQYSEAIDAFREVVENARK